MWRRWTRPLSKISWMYSAFALFMLVYFYTVQMHVPVTSPSYIYQKFQKCPRNCSSVSINQASYQKSIKQLLPIKYQNSIPILPIPITPSVMEKIKKKAFEIINVENLSWELYIWMQKQNLSQDDPLLIEYVREMYLVPPPEPAQPYKLLQTRNDYDPSDFNATQSVWHILSNFTAGHPGYFVECGANDGVFQSNTLWLEREHSWTGLLIEPHSVVYGRLRATNRKVWFMNACLSPHKTAKMVPFFYHSHPRSTGNMNGLRMRLDRHNAARHVQCFPFYTTMLAMNRTVVDYFSLDIEGLELEVLRTIPFDKILIKVLIVEYISVPEGPEGLRKFMEDQGYTLYAKNPRDQIFILTALFKQLAIDPLPSALMVATQQ